MPDFYLTRGDSSFARPISIRLAPFRFDTFRFASFRSASFRIMSFHVFLLGSVSYRWDAPRFPPLRFAPCRFVAFRFISIHVDSCLFVISSVTIVSWNPRRASGCGIRDFDFFISWLLRGLRLRCMPAIGITFPEFQISISRIPPMFRFPFYAKAPFLFSLVLFYRIVRIIYFRIYRISPCLI